MRDFVMSMIASCVVFACLTSDCRAFQVSVTEIADALRKHRSGIYSLSVDYRTEFQEFDLGSPSSEISDGRPLVLREFSWAEMGVRSCLRQKDLGSSLSPKLLSDTLHSTDGVRSWRVAFDPSGDPSKQSTTVVDRVLKATQGQSLADFLGWDVDGTSKSLEALLREAGDIVPEQDVIDGVVCYKVNVARWKQYPVDDVYRRLVCWFDTTHDLLPRRISISPELPPEGPVVSGKPLMGLVAHRFDVTKFQHFESANGRINQWFPVAGKYTGVGGNFRLLVSKVDLNTELNRDQFIPTIPPGTWVGYNLGTRREKIVNPRPPQAVPEPISPTPGEAMNSGLNASPASARPPAKHSVSRSLFVVSLLCLAYIISQKMKNQKSSAKGLDR